MDRGLVLVKQILLLTVTFWLTTVTTALEQETTALVSLNSTTAPPGSGSIEVILVTAKPGSQVTCLDECRCSLYRLMRSEDLKLRCDSEDTMTSFPVLAKEHNMSRIREM